MNVEILLRHFDTISEAPDAVPRLRRFIVNLAIAGKLAPSSGADITAGELLSMLIAARENEGAKRLKARPVSREDLPVDLPDGAIFVRLSEVAQVIKGATGIQSATPGCYPLVALSEERATSNEYQFDAAAAIVPLISSTGHGHASIKRLHYQEGKFALGNILCAVIPYLPELLSPRFLYEYLSAYKEQLLVTQMIGTANVSLTLGKVGDVPIPIVPLPAQARVCELMALCDKLEAAREQREVRRDRLVAATVALLARAGSTEDNLQQAAFSENVCSLLRNLASFTTKKSHISKLRELVRNLAVQGKLVAADPGEAPADQLYQELEQRRRELTAQGLLRSAKVLPGIPSDELPFAVPAHWKWVRLGDLAGEITSGSRGWAEFYADSGPKFIRAQNIRFGYLDLAHMAHVELPVSAEGKRTSVQKGDLLVVITGAGVTNPSMLDEDIGEAYVSQHVALVSPLDRRLSPWLLTVLMATTAGRGELQDAAYGAGKPGLNLDNLRMLRVPLPPLGEQQRINDKLSALLGVLDALEHWREETLDRKRRLLESLTQECTAVEGAHAAEDTASPFLSAV